MTYLIVPAETAQQAWAFSAAMWQLGRSETSEKTAYAVNVVEHKDGGVFALNLNAPLTYIQPDADIDAFVALLAEGAQEDFRQILQDARGTMADLSAMAQAVPFFTDYLRTHDQMQTEGWFPEPEDDT